MADSVRHICGVSGGKDSSALAVYLRDTVPDACEAPRRDGVDQDELQFPVVRLPQMLQDPAAQDHLAGQAASANGRRAPPVHVRRDPLQELRVFVQKPRHQSQHPPHVVIRISGIEKTTLRCPSCTHRQLPFDRHNAYRMAKDNRLPDPIPPDSPSLHLRFSNNDNDLGVYGRERAKMGSEKRALSALMAMMAEKLLPEEEAADDRKVDFSTDRIRNG